jgi:ribosomal-protein-alanine N-acetyltransferase
MPGLQRLRADHAPAVLAFELANRAYFARFISDRGDAFFEQFDQEHLDLLAAQEAGTCAFHVLVDDDGTVVGRFNLFDLQDATAVLGYRVAEHLAGQGVATATVKELCELASTEYELRTLTAATPLDNVASQRVLMKAGFVAVGPAQPGGQPGTLYQLDMVEPGTSGMCPPEL